MAIKCGTYKIYNIRNHKAYYGSSVNFSQRKNSHFNLLKRNIHYNKFLQRAYNKEPHNFTFIILQECKDSLHALTEEQKLLDLYCGKHFCCYNIAPRVENNTFGTKRNKETREKLSLAWYKNKDFHIKRLSGKNHPFYGRRGEDPQSKKCYCYDEEKNLVKIYTSIMDASRQTQINRAHIADVCSKKNEKRKRAGGFYWTFIENDFSFFDKKRVSRKGKNTKVYQYDNNHILINVYDTCKDAAKENNLDARHISMACLGQQKTAGGFIWKYQE